jgi:hypothetical protein
MTMTSAIDPLIMCSLYPAAPLMNSVRNDGPKVMVVVANVGAIR